MKLGEIAEHLGCVVEGNAEMEILGLAALQQAGPGELSFLDGQKYIYLLKTTLASALILPRDLPSPGVSCLRVEHPRLAFAKALALFYPSPLPKPGIHPSAVLGERVQVAENVHIGAHVVIGDDSVIGEGAILYPNCTLYNNVRIGARSVLHANCILHARTEIGEECIIQSGAVIGGEGFGFVPLGDGTWHKMPQAGHVILENRVEIGSNTTIDRPAVGFTRIGSGTKIDNLVMIGHGCNLETNCLLVSQVGLAGGVHLGHNVVLAGQVGIADHVEIGDRVVATAKSGIPGDIESGAMVSGYPAIAHPLFLRAATIFRRLPEMYQTIRELQRKLGDLQKKVDGDRS
ncbi:MAG: UDP-3-O-(3-hydroxymyristoyl)glucosamine N-acyltransferase [Anaerolineae bacterium]|nr:UDP-3-O-(3-hydroxymyristoyl)glucosamine N-acyltransferase [Gloeobacterales cyanobacterium ES-bin-313]